MSDTVLIDTDVASFFFKMSAHAERFRPLVEGKRLALSFVTVAEMYRWTIERKWGEPKVASLTAAMQKYVVLPFDNDLAWS